MTNIATRSLVEIAKRLKAMADTGLLFTQDEYDKERYEELQAISVELFAMESGNASDNIINFYEKTTDYPTPKVDVRAFLLNSQHELLMVQEKADKKWTIPGGWCEIGLTPKENIIKEMQEETGLNVDIVRLLAIFDKKCHPHPPQPHYVYKLVFLCKPKGEIKLSPNHEILNARFFPLHQLPSLSEDRILKSQIDILFNKVQSNDTTVYFE